MTPEMTDRMTKAQAAATSAKADFDAAEGKLEKWHNYSRWLTILIAAMLLGDAVLLPGLVRQTNAREAAERAKSPPVLAPPDVPQIGTHEDPTLGLHTRITDKIEWVNVKVGEFVAYWAVISVFGYYYEVIARFAFNSPTNWLHESMFLMYGMQYMLAGAYAYQCDQHVRVDVLLRQVLAARQSDRRHPHLGVLLHLRRHAAVDKLEIRLRRGRTRRSLVHRVGGAVLAGEADNADRRRPAPPARRFQIGQRHRFHYAR